MTSYFDDYGWLSETAIPGRETEVPVPGTPLPIGYAWNFTGYEWISLPYISSEIVSYNLKQELLRAEAYSSEADPIFFRFQRGEATREEWLTKIAEIKQRFPKR